MNALLMAIAIWLSANFGLPQTNIMPDIDFVPAADMATMRYRVFMADMPKGATPANMQMHPSQRQVLSVYDDATRTIYLLQDWTGRTPADLSILVHEMVHHMQNITGQRFECVQAREKMALEAQDRWLALFGRSLEKDFDIDPFTQLASGLCVY